MPAKRIGRYLVGREIGAGGMAAVHLGRLVGAGGFGRVVAVKRLHRHLTSDPGFREMFLDEARVAANVSHRNVVATLDFVSHEDELLLVMELVRGVSLMQIMATSVRLGDRIPVAIACTIAAGVLTGLHAAHHARDANGNSLALVHRDVSPQNVLVDADGVVKVVDFGIARARGRLHQTDGGELKGKLGYMSPEQLRGEPLDARADVYAAAVVLWEMLTGRPLRAGDAAATLYAALEGAAPPPSLHGADVPPSLDAVVGRALERDRDARFASAADMAEALGEAIAPVSSRELAQWVRGRETASFERFAGWIAELDAERAQAGPTPATQEAGDPLPPPTEPPEAHPLTAPGGTEILPGAPRRIDEREPNGPTTNPRRRRFAVAIGVAAGTAMLAALVATVTRSRRVPAEEPAAPNTQGSGCGGWGEPCCAQGCNAEHLGCVEGRCTGCADQIFGGDTSAATCARLRGGEVYCWGANNNQLFGVKAHRRAPRPFRLEGVDNPSQMAISPAAILYIKDGRVLGFGDPLEAVLGPIATPPSRIDPENAVDLGLEGVSAISLRTGTGLPGGACAIVRGQAHCWGTNAGGIGGTWSPEAPYVVLPPSHVVPHTKGLTATALAVSGDGPPCVETTVATACWRHASLYSGIPVPEEPVEPTDVAVTWTTGTPFAGGVTACLLRDGRPWCWGLNIHCELGTRSKPDPRQLRDPFHGGGIDFVSMALGEGHVCGLERDGGVMCWGDNRAGQVGIEPDPKTVCQPTPVAGLPGSASAVVAGERHTCVLDELGVVWCFGSDEFGELGAGSRDPALHRSTPLPVALPCATEKR